MLCRLRPRRLRGDRGGLATDGGLPLRALPRERPRHTGRLAPLLRRDPRLPALSSLHPSTVADYGPRPTGTPLRSSRGLPDPDPREAPGPRGAVDRGERPRGPDAGGLRDRLRIRLRTGGPTSQTLRLEPRARGDRLRSRSPGTSGRGIRTRRRDDQGTDDRSRGGRGGGDGDRLDPRPGRPGERHPARLYGMDRTPGDRDPRARAWVEAGGLCVRTSPSRSRRTGGARAHARSGGSSTYPTSTKPETRTTRGGPSARYATSYGSTGSTPRPTPHAPSPRPDSRRCPVTPDGLERGSGRGGPSSSGTDGPVASSTPDARGSLPTSIT